MNWSLEKYTGQKSRHTCPACERKRCFTLYVNEDGESLNPAVGRCDHEFACGYHYTPAQYFADHPEASDNWRQNFMSASIKIPKRKPTPKPLCYIPIDLVTRSVPKISKRLYTLSCVNSRRKHRDKTDNRIQAWSHQSPRRHLLPD